MNEYISFEIARKYLHEACAGLGSNGGLMLKIKFDQEPKADVIENKVLKLLLDWAIECGFGYDSIPEEYEKHKDYIQDMSYTEGLIYIAMKEVENGRDDKQTDGD